MDRLVLDASDPLHTLLLAVAARVVREPLPAVDLADEAHAELTASSCRLEALEALDRVLVRAARTRCVSGVERGRRRMDPRRLGPGDLAFVRRLGAAEIALDDEVLEQVHRLERTGPSPVELSRIVGSGRVTAAPSEVRHAD